ncbi:MAG: protein kinase [Planctomycetes bacterium]|nr:protein kinase [Planctomycetota bacterium]
MTVSSALLDARVGGFRLTQVVREDASGPVYQAVDAAGVRALVRALDPAAAPERLGCDLLALQALEHPRVASVLAVDEAAGRVLYAIEDRGRLTLADAVRGGRPLEERELIWLARELLAGLAAMHAVGLVHGGLGAQSIVLGPDGPAIVDLDWSARAGDAPDDGPSLADDVAALGRVLAFAATGAPADRGLGDRAPWLRRRVSGLIDALGADPARRPDAAAAARLFAQIARDAGLDDGQPPSLDELLETRAREVAGPAPALPLGRFGRYLLLEEVARGGMGVVYRARHADFERVFALKVMLEGALADETARRRFLREAEAAAALQHPSIVRVHDFGEVDGRAYIAMDFTEGCPLGDLLAASGAALEELLRVFLHVVRAVHYAHSRGIVHRDLKPDNILVDLQGCPRILDFGVAKRLGDGAGDTMAGELVGTPAYMSPEQAEARHDDIDTRSDVYSLGVTLFELVTGGRLPFEGHTVTDTLTRILLDEAPAPSAVRPGVPWELDAIVLKALEKPRERRYQSAAELAHDLERFLGGLPIRARQARASYRARKWLQRNWRATMVCALVSLAVGSSLLADRLRRRAEVAALVARGEAALTRQDAAGAHALFLQALALAPGHMAAGVGRERAERLREEVARLERTRQARAHAARLAGAGEAHLAAGRLERARAAFEQAVALDEHPAAARAGLARVARELAVREATERLASQQARDEALARQHEDDGQAHLAAGDFRRAQASFIRAVAFGSTRGEELLRLAEDGLLRERVAQVQQEVTRRDALEAARLRDEARAAARQGALDDARTLLLQALAFDGRDEGALEALVEVDRLVREREARADRAARLGQSRELLERAREAHARGRQRYRDGDPVDLVRDAYLDALEAFDRVLFVAPDDLAARAEKARVTRELAVVLRDDGQHALSEFVLRFGGLEAGVRVGPADLPTDPHLAVIEADRVSVRRAFGGNVRFLPTRAFDGLRERVRARGDRWRVTVLVRSEPTASIPPALHCRGLWVRLEDRQARTISPTVRVDFSGGPYPRLITVDAGGRAVAPFERSRGLDGAAYVARVEEAVMALIDEAEARRPTPPR